MPTRSWILALVGAASCAATEPPPPRAGSTRPNEAAPADVEAARPPSPAATPLTESSLTITNLAPGAFELESSAAIALASRATIEHRAPDGSWSALGNLDLQNGYRLLESCDAPTPACIELAADTVMRPVPFSGLDCSAQCNKRCRANSWVGPGELRLVVHTCNGDSIAGPSFALPSSEHAASMPRWGVTTDVVRASAMRLEIPQRVWNIGDPAAAGRVAGFDVRGKERALGEAELATLLDLLRSPTGYDDRIAKRCAFGTLVGFRLVRAPATTGEPREEDVEIAIDFTCQKLFVVQGGRDGRPRTVHGTHADPSRAGWLELAKRSLPDDRRLAREK
jgi:hypothetical protein